MRLPIGTRAALWAVLLLAALALPTTARAHGTLRASIPRSGARLDTVPRDLRLTFSEPVELAVARLTLTGPGGRAVPLSPLRRGASAAVIVADVAGAIEPGVYTVAWQVAGRDGHPVHGSFRFTVLPNAAGLAAAAAPPADPTRAAPPPRDSAHDTTHAPARVPAGGEFGVESPLYVVVRWLGLLGLLGVIGTAAFGLAVLPGAGSRGLAPPVAEAAARRARGLGLGAAALLAAGSLLRLVAQSAAVNGSAHALDPAAGMRLVSHTAWGHGWAMQAGAALLALAALALVRRDPSRAWPVVGGSALAAAVGTSLSGHAAAAETYPALAVVADVLHVLAAGGWVGTLLLLAGAGLAAARRAGAGERVLAAAALVSAFSPWALACAAVAAASGSVSAWLHLGAPAAFVSTAYGRTLLVKLALLVPAAATGAYNWRRIRPALAAGRDATGELSQSVAIELAAAVAVVAVTAILVAVQPAV